MKLLLSPSAVWFPKPSRELRGWKVFLKITLYPHSSLYVVYPPLLGKVNKPGFTRESWTYVKSDWIASQEGAWVESDLAAAGWGSWVTHSTSLCCFLPGCLTGCGGAVL